MNQLKSLKFLLLIVFLCAFSATAQDTNPVEKQVANPLTDTTDANPVAPESTNKTPKKQTDSGYQPEGGDDELVVYSEREPIEGEASQRVIVMAPENPSPTTSGNTTGAATSRPSAAIAV
ncbi:MAG: hypothetical protein LH472_14230, partial [Pyrinomonadaceae bacterium]|nr:hypothetical protein [Pyrinomonadaceae bacterium]